MADLTAAPPFGHPMRKLFAFEASYTNLNHGSYGSLPIPVLEKCEKLSREIEANPDRFMRSTSKPLLTTVRARVASLIGAQADECVIVPNATHGINTVLRNLEWHEGDIVVRTAVTYHAVSRTAQYISDMPPHPKTSTFALQLPAPYATIVQDFRAHLRGLQRNPGTKVVAIIDSIIALPGIRQPWTEMCKVCKEENVISIVDAAHSIGQETLIDVKNSDPDFWISNCHKWMYAKRGCAVLYVPKRNQHLIKTSLPTSHAYVSPSDPAGGPEAPNFVAQFEWTGTLDLAPYLSVNYALDFRAWLGGEVVINDYCHDLALRGGERLAQILGTRVLDENGEATANMVNVELPLDAPPSIALSNKVRERLSLGWNVSTSVPFHFNGKWWVRCSAQIFNEISDFEKAGNALKIVCSNINNIDEP